MIYAMGDLQGCYTEFMQLLEVIQFDATTDKLWLVGDLVNRGPHSLECLRAVKQLGDAAITVLGNHDLHLIAVFYGHQALKKADTLTEVLQAPDAAELMEWLCQRPLLHYDTALNFAMVHAGIPPQWTIQQALARAAEVEAALRGSNRSVFLSHLYGSQPECWRDELMGWDRLRIIINYFTRMRFCTSAGQLDLRNKLGVEHAPAGYYPWFQIIPRATDKHNIVFGHWAALQGVTNVPNVFAVDTGCAWGKALTALRIPDGKRFAVLSQVSP